VKTQRLHTSTAGWNAWLVNTLAVLAMSLPLFAARAQGGWREAIRKHEAGNRGWRFALLSVCLLGLTISGMAQQFPPTQSAMTFVPGIISTIAGTGVTSTSTTYGDGGPATSATVTTGIRGIVADSAGDVFFVDGTNYTVRVVYEGGGSAAALITAENSSVTTPVVGDIYVIAGVEGTHTALPTSGHLATAQDLSTAGAAMGIDAAGDIFFSPVPNELWVIYAGGSVAANLIKLEDGVSSPILGYEYQLAGAYPGAVGTAGTAGIPGLAYTAELDSVNGIKVDGSGNVYIVNQGSSATCTTTSAPCGQVIDEISATTGNISIIAGANTNATAGGCANNASALTCELNQPYDVAVDSAGDVYIDDKQAQLIRMVYEGGTQAQNFLAILYPTITPTVGFIYTVAGGTTGTGTANGNPTIAAPVLAYGSGTIAYLHIGNGATGMTIDPAGNLYLIDNQAAYTNAIEINTTTGYAYLVGGTGVADATPTSANGDGGPATSAQFDVPRSLYVDAAGRIYITDATNIKVRQIGPAALIAFTNQSLNETSLDQSLVLTNSGNGPATFGTPVFAGTNPGDFAVDTTTTTCVSPLAVGASCTLNVKFTPAASGPRAATLTYTTTDGVVTSHVISLTGTSLPATTTVLTTSLASVVVSTPVTFTATVTGTSGTAPTGTVTFYNGTTVLGTGTISSGVATYVYTPTTIATTVPLSITASYASDGTNGSSVSSAVSVYVTGSTASTTTLTASSTNLTYGTSETFTATVTSGATGSVKFYTNGTLLASSALSSSVATLTTTTLPTAANQSITAYYSGDSTYQSSNSSGTPLTVTVTQATPAITWATPAAITYGAALSATQLDATSPVAGTFSYNKTVGTVLTAGNQALSATFAPTDTVDYTSTATASVTLVVNKVAPTITWATPAPIVINTALSGTQLDATATGVMGSTLPGTFTYTPAAGVSFSSAGNQTLSVSFVPSDTTDYISPATASVQLSVSSKATPTITWTPSPTTITYGTALSTTQLNASATVAGTAVAGTFAYNLGSATGTALSVGYVLGVGSQQLYATFTPTNGTAYNTVTGAPVTLQVNAATPTITWTPSPTTITYGTALIAAQLSPTASVAGTNVAGSFTFSTPTVSSVNVGTVLGAGNQTITATFTPTNGAEYNSTTFPVTLTVSKATPTITWTPSPTTIISTTPLSANQLDATASVAGTNFVYTLGSTSGTVLTVGSLLASGNPILYVTFTPSDATDYATVSTSVTLTVIAQSTPTITWATPSAITYGTALSATQFNATASVAGTFVYSPVAGTVPTAGSLNLTATFTPTNTTNYTNATATVTLTVNKATPTITWATPTAITYGTALSATQLNATASVAGTLAYTPALGVVPTAGSQTLQVTFTPTDTTDYANVTATVTLVVNQITPTISWATPAVITYGTALSATQLNATASVAGTFVYIPALGVVPAAGTPTLTATFTPTDAVDYSSATASVTLTVIGIGVITPPVLPDGSGPTETVLPDGVATYSLPILPSSGTTFPSALTLTVSGLPAGATASITPSSWVQSNGSTWTLAANTALTGNTQLTIQVPRITATVLPETNMGRKTAPFALALLLLPFASRMRRAGKRLSQILSLLLLLVVSMAAMVGMSGCSPTGGFFALSQQAYPLTVTVTSGTQSSSTTLASTTLTLTVE
jgi:hypothetical protein